MARPLRIEFPGAVYHVTSRGNERRAIFRSDKDRHAFIAYLALAVRRFRWSVSAWVLMTNHFHLVIQTPEPNLSKGMQWLKGSYAAWFNKRHGRSGHLFQGRFKALLVEKDAYFSEVLRYVVLNPVRAGIVPRAEAYRWSSYRATAGLVESPDWLDVDAVLSTFDGDDATARDRYQDFVLDPIEPGDHLWDRIQNGMYLGTESWTKEMRALVESQPRSTDFPTTQRAVGRPQMHTVIAAVARAAGESVETVRSQRGSTTRRLAAWLGWHEGLITLRSIAASLRLRSEGYISSLIRRCEGEFESNHVLLAHLDLALADLRS